MLIDRGLSNLLHSELHCLDVHQRVQYKLGVTIFIGASRIVLPILGGLLHAYVWRFQSFACGQPTGVSQSCHDTVAVSSDVDRSPVAAPMV